MTRHAAPHRRSSPHASHGAGVRRRAFAATALAAALPLGLVVAAGGTAAAGPGGRETAPDAAGPGTTTTSDGRTVPQTSDGVVGPTAPAVPSWARQAARRTNESGFRVGPGLMYRQWDQTDARGRVRAYLLRANLGRGGLEVDYVGGDVVPSLQRVKAMVRADGGVGGVNGDFFDISDTGAPIGVGVKDGVTLHGPAQPLGWNISFVIGADGTPAIRRSPTQTLVTARPKLRVNNVNSPRVLENGIGLYTSRWGRAPGFRALDGASARNVRQVVIRDGRVVSNTRTVWRDREIDGRLLLGRGGGADTLRRALPVGTRTRVVVGTTDSPGVAISGNVELLRDGDVVTRDDVEMHPRTAVGIDEDGERLLLLVVDGRQSFSRGYTMLELARMMRSLGAEDALNLDGGGSSTLVARRESGRLGVLNSPSDGQARLVPNGLSFGYAATGG